MNNATTFSTINRYDLYCPVCGDNTLRRYLHDESMCIHVLYMFFPEEKCFSYVDEKACDAVTEEEVYGESLTSERFAEVRSSLPPSVLHWTIETDPRTIGALPHRIIIGFDMDIVQPRSILSWSEPE